LFAKIDELLPQHSIQELQQLLPNARNITQKALGMKEYLADQDYKEIEKQIPEEIIEAVEAPYAGGAKKEQDFSLQELESALSSVEARLKELS